MGLVQAGGTGIGNTWQELRALDGRLAPCRETMRRDLVRSGDHLWHGRWSALPPALKRLGCDLACLWTAARGRVADTTSDRTVRGNPHRERGETP